MRRSITITRNVVLIGGVIQLVLGALFWASIADNLVPLHMVVGMVVVLSLWYLAFAAARAGVGAGLVTVAVAWGLIVPALGFTQTKLLPDGAHWIIQVVHLAVGLTALALALVLASRATGALDAAKPPVPTDARRARTR